MNSSAHTHAIANRQIQRGLSLIELMISITLGLIILTALSTLFLNQSRTRAELDKSNRMIDNGRYALEILSDNLRLAGFYGNYMPSGEPAATPDPCALAAITTAPTSIPLDMLFHHVQGYDAATATSVIASPPCSLTSLKPGSDILVLRRASTSAPVEAANATVAPNGNNTVYLQVSNCSTDQPSPNPYQISLGSAPFTTLHKKDCTTAASLRPFLVQAYFVSPDNNAGDGIPTLKRRELDPATGAFVTTSMVEGIEYMQVEYGIDGVDTNGDGVPDRFNVSTGDIDGAADAYSSCSACSPAQWANVVSVKINIIARNTEPTTGYTDTKTYSLGGPTATPVTFTPAAGDHYKRHAYTQVIRLVNPSSRKEVP